MFMLIPKYKDKEVDICIYISTSIYTYTQYEWMQYRDLVGFYSIAKPREKLDREAKTLSFKSFPWPAIYFRQVGSL